MRQAVEPTFKAIELTPHCVTIERSQLASYARVIGETNPVYFDESAAQSAGYRSVVMLPTFAFSLYNMQPDPLLAVKLIEADQAFMLHGEQGFEFSTIGSHGTWTD